MSRGWVTSLGNCELGGGAESVATHRRRKKCRTATKRIESGSINIDEIAAAHRRAHPSAVVKPADFRSSKRPGEQRRQQTQDRLALRREHQECTDSLLHDANLQDHFPPRNEAGRGAHAERRVAAEGGGVPTAIEVRRSRRERRKREERDRVAPTEQTCPPAVQSPLLPRSARAGVLPPESSS